ncbi:MAG: helix-turn-helix transcriptional regulator [Romboutsia sp.]
MKTFGDKFKELRIEKKLKQQELAEDFNNIYGYTFSKSSISQYENDKRRPETDALRDFALYFNVSIDYLVGISNNKNLDKPDDNVDLQSEAVNIINNYFENNNISRKDKDNMYKELCDMYFKTLG